VRFIEVVERCHTRIEIVATFMALLELIRLGEVSARQYEEFGEIWLFARERLVEGGDSPAAADPAPPPARSEGETEEEAGIEASDPTMEIGEDESALMEAEESDSARAEEDEILTPYPEGQP
jgi:hypothetical protein